MASFKLVSAVTSALALMSALSPLTAAQSLPDLRIMPLGDSITKGATRSSDGCGYRSRLREKLLNYGTDTDIKVNMIGSLSDGKMEDNDHEGHSGKLLSHINTYWKKSIRARPNVVLLHAGTNNMDLQIDIEGAPGLMESIIDGLFENAPDVVVLVAPVIWANDPAMQARTDAFNQKLGSIIEAKQKAGKHILSVPIDIELTDLADKKHPNDKGYEKMASAWFNRILDAHERNWLKSPVKVNADELPGMGLGTGSGGGGGGGSIVSGSCKDGIWEKKGTIFEGFRVWEEVGTIRGPVENARRDKVLLADLNNDGIADYILADDDGTVRAWLNQGKPNQWTSLGKVNPDWSTIEGNMIRLADVDNDGKADLIALDSDGSAKVWRNANNGKKFESLDSKWATGLESNDKIRFEDMDGDGYADYVILYEGGSVKWARNTHNNGKDSSKRNWDQAETIAPGPAGMPAGRARLHDLDGDGKADYLIVYEGGAVKAFRNTGNLNSGGTGQRNFDDIGTIAPGISGVSGDMIRFADMDGDGLSDFLSVADDGSIRMWKNLGIVGTKGASMRFADLNGDRKDDIISVDKRGRAQAWLNKGVGSWDSIGEIAPGLDEDLSGAEIDFADVNGDGLADYLVIYGGGAVKAYLNNGNIPDKGKDRTWQPGVVISEGVGEPGRKVKFADLNGDGYADYLVVFDGGAVDCYLNRKNIPPKDGGRIWEYKQTVATGVGETGSKVRFADLTGDGKADYIIQYLGGAADAYNNTGNIPDIGRVRNWDNMGTVAGGVSPQGPVRYADINGDGKADYLVVFGGGAVNAYINSCDWKAPDLGPGTGGGGDNDGLNGNSTCKELQAAYPDGIGVYPREAWDRLGTQQYWADWLKYDADAKDNVVAAFGHEWGIDGVSCRIWGECVIGKSCSDYNRASGSGKAHLISQALNNIHNYYAALKNAVESTEGQFGILRDFFKTYYPEPDLEDVGLKTLLGLTSTLWSGGAGLASGPGGTISSTIVSTLTTSITDALDASQEELDYSDRLATAGFDFLNKSTVIIHEVHDQLLEKGKYVGADGNKVILDDIFEHGRWLDSTLIPILNINQNTNDGRKSISTEELGNWWFNFLHASVLNFAWKNQIVYIAGYPMTKEEFDANSKDLSEDVDESLRVYYDGMGYVFSSYAYSNNLGPQFDEQNPPGYENLANNTLNTNFDASDIIKSSVDTFSDFGYGYDASAFPGDVITDGDWDTWKKLTPRTPGIFSIPVCILDEDDTDLEWFWSSANEINGGIGLKSVFCLCKDKEDNDGNKFSDQIPYGDDLVGECRADSPGHPPRRT